MKISPDDTQFETLDLEKYERLITDKHLLTLEDSSPVFQRVEEWLKEAMKYYNADTEASEYAVIVQDLSSAYKYLAFFDENTSNQCKLHKKRADLLEELITQFNQTYYLNVFREVWYELGLTYSTMLDIKLDQLQALPADERPTPHALNKINTLCEKSITKFNLFLDSYKPKDQDEMPSTFEPDILPLILFCYFHLGRLFYKIITPDKKLQISNISNSFKYYTLVVTTCSENKEAATFFNQELAVCTEMVSLLPRKMQKLLDEI